MPDKKYIDADALITTYERYMRKTEKAGNPDIAVGYSHAINIAMLMPAADVAPVVRCKDCKWFGKSRMGGGWCNEVMARPMPPDGFCNYGERRDA